MSSAVAAGLPHKSRRGGGLESKLEAERGGASGRGGAKGRCSKSNEGWRTEPPPLLLLISSKVSKGRLSSCWGQTWWKDKPLGRTGFRLLSGPASAGARGNWARARGLPLSARAPGRGGRARARAACGVLGGGQGANSRSSARRAHRLCLRFSGNCRMKGATPPRRSVKISGKTPSGGRWPCGLQESRRGRRGRRAYTRCLLRRPTSWARLGTGHS